MLLDCGPVARSMEFFALSASPAAAQSSAGPALHSADKCGVSHPVRACDLQKPCAPQSPAQPGAVGGTLRWLCAPFPVASAARMLRALATPFAGAVAPSPVPGAPAPACG